MKQFTKLADVPDREHLIERAFECKHSPHAWRTLGNGRILGMVFFNPSLRTRVSTHRAASLLGMDVVAMTVGADVWTLETRDGTIMDAAAAEHIREAAAVMGRYVDVLGIRAFARLHDRLEDYAETVLERFAELSGVPIVSLESATRHPLQSLADIMTIEQFKRYERPRVVLTWAPHPKALPQAVPNSFAEWTLAMGYDVVIAHPPGYELDERFTNGAAITTDQNEALDGADFVYAKNWSSYRDYGKILSQDMRWQITPEKMALTREGYFMHCLPIRRNMIASDAVLDSPRSIVVEQAANRVPAAQAVLRTMLESL
ncbi:MAG: N-acetylornithine carbamoyltransferase [Chlorobi bacterium]|nr:N-acetylornithine carbamoyltransferase [Chlorobiota bacterium]